MTPRCLRLLVTCFQVVREEAQKSEMSRFRELRLFDKGNLYPTSDQTRLEFFGFCHC